MQSFRKHLRPACTVITVMSAAISARGAGFDLPDLDAFATGRGMAVVATADNPSAIYFNPAGITQLNGANLRGGVYGISLIPSYTSPGGGTFDNQNQLHAVPQAYFTYKYQDSPWSFGFGIYSPFGLGLQWPENTGFRTVTGGLDSSVTYMTFNPVIALKVVPGFSVAAGVTANYASAHLKQGLPYDPTPGGNYFEFKGTGWGTSYNIGVLLQPWEKLSFGFTFRGQDTINLQGHTTTALIPEVDKSDANVNFNFPLEAILGVSYRPTPKWNLEFDAEYMDWKELQSVTIHQSSPSPLLPLASIPVQLGWQSSWYFEWGATRYLNHGWHVSAGYIFSENSDPNKFYTPASADLDRHFFSVGLGRKYKNIDVDIAYQFGYGPPSNVTGSTPTLAGQTSDGKYKWISNAIAISAGIHF